VWPSHIAIPLGARRKVDNRKSKSASLNRARRRGGFSYARRDSRHASPPICKVQLAAVALVKVPYRLATIA